MNTCWMYMGIRIKKCMQRAGDGNRTHVSSLEGWCSTIELHPHIRYVIIILTNRCYHTTEKQESQWKNHRKINCCILLKIKKAWQSSILESEAA